MIRALTLEDFYRILHTSRKDLAVGQTHLKLHLQRFLADGCDELPRTATDQADPTRRIDVYAGAQAGLVYRHGPKAFMGQGRAAA